MLTATAEQTDAIKINIDAFMTLSKIAFTSVERLAALNLSSVRAVLEEGAAASDSMLQKKNAMEPRSFAAIPSTAAKNTAAYLQSVRDITTETQSEVNKLLTSYMAPLTHGLAPSAGWLKGFDFFKGYASKMTEMTEATSKAVEDAVTRMVPAAAASSKKTV